MTGLGFVDQTVALGRRLVAQDGIRPSPEQGGPQHRSSRRITRESGIDTPVQPLPSPLRIQLRIVAGSRAASAL